MIAANYRRFADALIRQIEMDFSDAAASEAQRAAWWQWLMTAGIPQAVRAIAIPAWLGALRRRAHQLALAIKHALVNLF